MKAILFDGDDRAYLRWVAAHPEGFVVNMRRRPDSEYFVLHRARCKSIQRHRNMDGEPGGFTERSYRKLCASSVSVLEDELRRLMGARTGISKQCSRCGPL